MQKSKVAKSSPKKGNVAEISCRTVLAIDFIKQNLLQDVKKWNEELSILEPSIDKIEKVSKKELVLKSHELSKEFSTSQTKMKKLNHDIEIAQNHLNKALLKFETKLLEPLSKGKFNNQTPSSLAETNENISKIQNIFVSCQQLFAGVTPKCLTNTERLRKLEDLVNKLCLPDEVEEAAKINEKLNSRIEALCQETARFFVSPDPEQYDPKIVTSTIALLFDAHRKGEKLLEQVQKNLHIPLPETLETKRSPSPTPK